MKITNYDDTATVNQDFLGPAGWTLPWVARYPAYGVGLTLGVIAVGILLWTGLGFGMWTCIYSISSVVALTRWLGHKITYETPARQVFKMFRHEVSAPRRPMQSYRAVLIPGEVTYDKPSIRTRLLDGMVAAVFLPPLDGSNR